MQKRSSVTTDPTNRLDLLTFAQPMLRQTLPSGSLSREAQLLLHAARTRVDRNTDARIRGLVGQDIDWSYAFELATFHHVVALVYWNLRKLPVPKPVLELFRTNFHARGARTLRMTSELLEMLRRLEAAGVCVLPYKGPVLAAAVFANPALRTYYDLDVLVQERDVQHACTVLRKMGYAGAVGDRLPPSKSQLTLVHPDHGTRVEVHWRLAPPRLAYDFDLKAIWQRREPVELHGTVVYTLGAEDLLILLCTHGAKHFWGRLHWLCSVAETLHARPALDWRTVLQQADQLQARRALLLGLRLARDLLDAPVPPSLHTQLEHRAITALVAQVQTWLFQDPSQPSSQIAPERLRRAWFQLRVREHLRDGLRYGLHRLKQTTIEATQRLRQSVD